MKLPFALSSLVALLAASSSGVAGFAAPDGSGIARPSTRLSVESTASAATAQAAVPFAAPER